MDGWMGCSMQVVCRAPLPPPPRPCRVLSCHVVPVSNGRFPGPLTRVCQAGAIINPRRRNRPEAMRRIMRRAAFPCKTFTFCFLRLRLLDLLRKSFSEMYSTAQSRGVYVTLSMYVLYMYMYLYCHFISPCALRLAFSPFRAFAFRALDYTGLWLLLLL
jgi:hypothetical protein